MALLLSLLAAGCQGDTSDDPSHTAGSGGSSPTGPSSGATPTDDPTSSGPPAATGPLVLLPDFELHVPDGFEVDDSVDIAISATDPATSYSITVSHVPDALEKPLGSQVTQSRRLGPWRGPAPRRLADVTVADAAWYHLSGRMAGFDQLDAPSRPAVPLLDDDKTARDGVAENSFHGLGHRGPCFAGAEDKDAAASGQIDRLAGHR